MPIIIFFLSIFVVAILPNIKQQSYMDHLDFNLDQLKCIVDSCEKLRLQLLFEEKVFRAELSDRFEKGLKGDEAIEHFNSFMLRFGLKHMVLDPWNYED